jgi:uncharacterized protein
MKIRLLLCLLWIAPVPALAQAPGNASLLRIVAEQAVAEVIRPGYEAFSTAADGMRTAMEQLCASPSQGALDASRNAFGALAVKWGQIEFVGVGPVMREDRLERILLWPDRRGIGLRQVQKILADEDAAAASVQTLAEKSVAVQGLAALEFVLFATGSDQLLQAGSYRCAYGMAIADNIAGIGHEIATEWEGTNPLTAAAEAGADTVETLKLLIGALVHGLENIRDIRVGAILGDEPANDKPNLALFRRSGNTFAVIDANLAGLSALFSRSEMAYLLPGEVSSIGESVAFEFAEASSLLEQLDVPVEDVLADPEKRNLVVLLDVVLGSLIDRIDQQYAPAAGVDTGFSFSDGD